MKKRDMKRLTRDRIIPIVWTVLLFVSLSVQWYRAFVILIVIGPALFVREVFCPTDYN